MKKYFFLIILFISVSFTLPVLGQSALNDPENRGASEDIAPRVNLDKSKNLPVNLRSFANGRAFSSISFTGYPIVSLQLGNSSLDVLSEGPKAFAGDIAPYDTNTMFIIHSEDRDIAEKTFSVVDLSTGNVKNLGTSILKNDETYFNELAVDPTDGTFYACSRTHLYSIDPSNGESTEIGAFGVDGSIMIAIAIDDNGNMFGHEITSDQIFSINKETGQATVIGPTGIDANYAQGMDYDHEGGRLIMAAYLWDGESGGETSS